MAFPTENFLEYLTNIVQDVQTTLSPHQQHLIIILIIVIRIAVNFPWFKYTFNAAVHILSTSGYGKRYAINIMPFYMNLFLFLALQQ